MEPPATVLYNSVKALMVCWKDSTQKEFETQLHKLLQEFKEYNFDVEPVYKIESVRPHQTLSARLESFLRYDADKTLLIIYYGGHGMNNKDKNNIWLRDDPATADYASNPKVNWSALQSLFLDECKSHVLFLLDCCFAASSVQYTDGSSTVESIVAAGFDKVAPLRGKNSFTTFLTATLKDCRLQGKPVYASRLCSMVSSRLNRTEWLAEEGTSRRVTPHHLAFSNNPQSVQLGRLETFAAIGNEAPSAEPTLIQPESLGPDELPTIAELLEEDHPAGEAATRGGRQSTEPANRLEIGADAIERLSTASPTGSVLSRQSERVLNDTPSPVPSDVLPGYDQWQTRVGQDTRQTRIWPRRGSYSEGSMLPFKSLDLEYIRLLHIFPSQKVTDPIFCYFTSREFQSDFGEYKAMSWVWGKVADYKEMKEVFILENNHKYSIPTRPNLDQALRRIRGTEEEVVLWVDALCLDQKNMAEKVIENAPFIFRNASEVIVWLGNGDEDSETAINFIPQLVNLTEFDLLVKSDKTPAQWQALVNLMRNPYFSRRWVFLEVILAKRAVLYCGNRQVDWADFCDAVVLLGSRFEEIQYLCKRAVISGNLSHELDNLVDLRALPAYSVVEASRDLFRRSSDGSVLSMCTLETLVSALPGLQASVPVDVIYALLPVASDQKAMDLVRDYTLPVSDVYQQFVRHCARSAMSIDIICTPWAPILGSEIMDKWLWKGPKELPSWICTVNNLPFGRRKKNVYGRRNGDVLVGHPNRRHYNAARGTAAVPIFGHVSSNGKTMLDGTMTVSGFLVGVVEELGFRAAGGTLHSEWIDMCGWRPGETFVPDHFWRTLVADRGPSGTPTPTWYHRACQYWLDFYDGEDVTYDVLQHKHHPSTAIQYMQRVQSIIWNRRLFTLHDKLGQKLYGLAPKDAKMADGVAILHGSSVPVLLRQHKDWWTLIGECFVYGIMDGEAVQIEEYLEGTREFLLR